MKGGTRQSRQLANATTVASIGIRRIIQLQNLLQLSSPTSENAQKAKFAEFLFHAVSILEDGCGRRLGAA
jgi:hypothetical protein